MAYYIMLFLVVLLIIYYMFVTYMIKQMNRYYMEYNEY